MNNKNKISRRAISLSLAATGMTAMLGIRSSNAQSSSGLVIDGEQIASAELLAKAKAEGSITLYSGYYESQERELAAAFNKDTGVTVNLLTQSGGTLIERVLSEHGAGQLKADVMRLTDPGYQARMISAGVLEPYKVPNWDVFPAAIKNADGNYLASLMSMTVFGYNTDLVKDSEAPKSWQEILNPKWKKKIGMWNIDAGGSPWGIALIQRQKWGIEYWQRFAAQDVRFFPQGQPAAEEVARGELAITVNGLEALATVIKNGAPMKLVFPQDGVIVIPHFISLAAKSTHPNAAKIFANWSASKRGAAAAATAGCYTSNPDAPAIELEGKKLPRPSEITTLVPDSKQFIELRKQWIQEWKQVFNRS